MAEGSDLGLQRKQHGAARYSSSGRRAAGAAHQSYTRRSPQRLLHASLAQGSKYPHTDHFCGIHTNGQRQQTLTRRPQDFTKPGDKST